MNTRAPATCRSLAIIAFALLALNMAAARAALQTYLFVPYDSAQSGQSPAIWDTFNGSVDEPVLNAIRNYHARPGVDTARALLGHYDTIAQHPQRERLLNTAPELFISAELLKFDAAISAALELHDPSGRGAALSLRVGSSAERLKYLIDWAARPGASLTDLQTSTAYIRDKLFKTDDDVTNFASREARSRDAGIETRINGASANGRIAQLLGYDAERTLTGFLAPHRAVKTVTALDAAGTPAEPLHARAPSFLKALKAANAEAYNGVFAEEQLDRWARERGLAIDLARLASAASAPDRAARAQALQSATGAYSDTPQAKAVAEEYALRSLGENDADAWFANNLRMATVVHEGSLQDQAKYLLRSMLWFEFHGVADQKVPIAFTSGGGLKRRYSGGVPKEFQAFKQSLGMDDAEFNAALNLASAIRDPKSEEDTQVAVDRYAGGDQERAAALIERVHELTLLAAHRMQVERLAEITGKRLKAHFDAHSNDPLRLTQAPDVNELLGDRRFAALLDSMAGAYVNLPERLVDGLKTDLARYLLNRSSGENAYSAEVAATLLKAVHLTWKGADETRAQRFEFEAIAKHSERLKKAIEEHMDEQVERVDIDGFVNKVALGDLWEERLIVELDNSGRPLISIQELQLTPKMIREDLDRMGELAEIFGWKHTASIDAFKAFVDSREVPDAIVSQLGGPWSVTWLKALREFAVLYDPDSVDPLTLRYTTIDGETVTGTYRATRLDAGVNLGVLMLKASFKFGQQAWGLWDDISDARDLASAVATIARPPGNQTAEQAARTHAMALSKSISLMSYAETFGLMAQQPYVVDKFGGSLAQLALLSADPFDRKTLDDLMFAVFKDIAVLKVPQLGAAFFLYSVGKWAYTKVTVSSANKAFVSLLLRNGEWNDDTNDGVPVLEGVYGYGGHLLPYDPQARGKACLQSAASSERTSGRTRPMVIGLAHLAKLPPTPDPGVKLRPQRKPGDSTASPDTQTQTQTQTLDSGEVVYPRQALMTIYNAEGHDNRDPVIEALRGAVESTANRVRGAPNTWTRKWLTREGIRTDAREDDIVLIYANLGVSASTETRINATTATTLIDRPAIGHRGLPDTMGLPVGAKRLVGHLVAQYWARRQYLLECVLIDRLVKEAARQRATQRLNEVDSGFEYELSKIERRLHRLDEEIWPSIAPSARPIAKLAREPGAGFPILKEFKQRLARSGVRELLRRYDADATGDVGLLPTRKDEAQALLQRVMAVAEAYETHYREVLSSLRTAAGRVASGSALDGRTGPRAPDLKIIPAHVQLGTGDLSRTRALDSGRRPDYGPDNMPALTPGAGMIQSAYLDPDTVATLARKRVETWTKVYAATREKTSDAMTERLREFMTANKPLAEVAYPPPSQAPIDPMAALLQRAGGYLGERLDDYWDSGEYDLASRHPLYARLLRAQYQHTKIELARTMKPAPDDQEVRELLATMVYGGDNGAVSTSGAGALPRLATDFEGDARRTLDLAFAMAKLKPRVHTKPPLRLTKVLHTELEVTQNHELQGPDVERFKALVARYRWELASFPGARPEDCAGQPEAEPVAVDVKRRPPAHAAAGAPAPPIRFRARLRKAGRYQLRATALTSDDIPIAAFSEPFPFDAWQTLLNGELVVNGPWDSSTSPVALFLHGPDKYRGERLALLTEAGAIKDLPVCDFSERAMPTSIAEPGGNTEGTPAPVAVALAATAGVETVETSRVEERVVLAPRSLERSVEVLADGRLKIDGPLTLNFGSTISVSVEVTDASGAKVSGAKVTVNGSALAGDSIDMELEPDTPVDVSATIPVGGVEVSGSVSVDYNTDLHTGSMLVTVPLDYYDTGNLKSRGRFAPYQLDGQTHEVAGGTVRSNLASTPLAVQAGGAFQLSNERPVRLSETISLDAMLRGAGDRLLKPSEGRVLRKVVTELGDIPVTPYDLMVDRIRVRVMDTKGKQAPANKTSVKLGTDDARRAGQEFEGAATFRKWGERLPIAAEFTMPAGLPVKAEVELALDDIGGPLNPRAPAEPVEIAMPMYLPGSLNVIGTMQARPPGGVQAPSMAKQHFTEGDATLAYDYQQRIGQKFLITPKNPLRIGDPVTLEASADADGLELKGHRRLPVPQPDNRAAILNLGLIELRASADLTRVPPVAGKTREKAAEALIGAGLADDGNELGPPANYVKKERPGQVAGAKPPEGKLVTRGTPVKLVVRAPYRMTTVPDVGGWSEEIARGTLSGAQLRPGKAIKRPYPTRSEQAGKVQSTVPPKDAKVPYGKEVTLIVYRQPRVEDVDCPARYPRSVSRYIPETDTIICVCPDGRPAKSLPGGCRTREQELLASLNCDRFPGSRPMAIGGGAAACVCPDGRRADTRFRSCDDMVRAEQCRQFRQRLSGARTPQQARNVLASRPPHCAVPAGVYEAIAAAEQRQTQQALQALGNLFNTLRNSGGNSRRPPPAPPTRRPPPQQQPPQRPPSSGNQCRDASQSIVLLCQVAPPSPPPVRRSPGRSPFVTSTPMTPIPPPRR